MTRHRFGYGTNGFADHRLDDALAVIADLGYEGVALTLDHHHLDPFLPGLPGRLARLRHRLNQAGFGLVIETGGRYLLDPRRKHQPTLLSGEGAQRRIDLLIQAVRIAAELGAEAMSFWSGAAPPGITVTQAWDRLTAGCEQVLKHAESAGVWLGFEPEPGMFIDTLDRYDELGDRLGFPDLFGLTLDLGHCQCLEPEPVASCVRRAMPRLVNVQIEDMCRGTHAHLEFGQGEIDFPPVLHALSEGGYAGLISVELPRHSHAAPEVAERSLAFLRRAARQNGAAGRPADDLPTRPAR
jgi:sugar phosphate isomerase/epimerase